MLTWKYSWIFGFVGLFGLMGIQGEPISLLLFSMFAVFGRFWWNKLEKGSDERLAANKYLAGHNVLIASMVLMFGASVAAYFFFNDYLTLYRVQLAIVSLGFAGSNIAWAYLTARYDQ